MIILAYQLSATITSDFHINNRIFHSLLLSFDHETFLNPSVHVSILALLYWHNLLPVLHGLLYNYGGSATNSYTITGGLL